jgi:DNA-binding GntR family transcriptional regulator
LTNQNDLIGDPIKIKPTRKLQSSSEEIFRDIVRGLYAGRYVPGQRLVEADLTQEYGVSRSTAREALRQLGTEGLVHINLHRGARIRRLNRKEMNDILGLVEVLTGYSSGLCATRMDDLSVQSVFTQYFQDLLAFEERPDSLAFVRARNRFFRALVDLSGNGELQRLMPTLHLHLIRVQVKSQEIENQMVRFEDYREIGEAILQRDAVRAEALARRHVRNFAAVISSMPDHRF